MAVATCVTRVVALGGVPLVRHRALAHRVLSGSAGREMGAGVLFSRAGAGTVAGTEPSSPLAGGAEGVTGTDASDGAEAATALRATALKEYVTPLVSP